MHTVATELGSLSSISRKGRDRKSRHYVVIGHRVTSEVTVSIRHKLMGDMIHAHFQKLNVVYLGNIN